MLPRRAALLALFGGVGGRCGGAARGHGVVLRSGEPGEGSEGQGGEGTGDGGGGDEEDGLHDYNDDDNDNDNSSTVGLALQHAFWILDLATRPRSDDREQDNVDGHSMRWFLLRPASLPLLHQGGVRAR